MNLFENLKIIDEDESEITLNQVTTRSKALDYLSQNIYEYSKEGDSGIFKELMATVMKNKEYSKVINLMFDGAFYFFYFLFFYHFSEYSSEYSKGSIAP